MTRNGSTVSSANQEVRVLSETDIQSRLYGRYLGARRPMPALPGAVSADPEPMPIRPEPAAAVLSDELTRLQEELFALRREREVLQTQLNAVSSIHESCKTVHAELVEARTAPSALGQAQGERLGFHESCSVAVPPMESRTTASSGSGFGWSRLFGVLLVLGVTAGYVGGVRILQASPGLMGEPAPYTIQVAVYDSKVPAERTVRHLRGLDYDAFLADLPRMDGRARWRVYVGSFITREEARLEELRLAQDPRLSDFKDAFVLFR